MTSVPRDVRDAGVLIAGLFVIVELYFWLATPWWFALGVTILILAVIVGLGIAAGPERVEH
jgi:hypothetical protein